MTTGSSLFSKITGGKKFDGLAIKRVYFGNWLRDYSQAIDIGTLSRGISPEIIRIVLWIMAFTEFGYGTKEFEVTIDRLGVYRAEEHIDNPKGYGEGIDARMYDKRLRGPVDPRELDIDSRTGLKNYICNEEGNWPTSSEYVRTSLHEAIARGRKARTSQGSDEDQYEAMRLLGQALHTLEDYSAHSNYCELVLRELGHTDVFPYVGSKCLIELGGRSVYPIVTGSFGGLDFVHSLMGGAQDSLSQIEIGQVQSSLENGANNSDAGENLKLLLDKLPFDLGSTNSDGSSTSANEDFVTPFSQAAAAKAAADAQQAAAAAGSRSIGGSGGSAAGAGYGALMGLAANSMSGFGSTSTANTVPVTDPSVNNTANYDAEIDSGSIGDHKFDSMDIGSDIGEENSWRAMESQQKLQVDDNEETNEPEEESGKSEKSSDEESEKSSDKESNKSFDKESNKSSDEESNKSSDEESNKSSDEESNKSSDEESNKSSDEESNKSSDEEEPQEEYSSDRGFQSEEQEHEPEEEFEEEVEERESERESEEEPEKEYEPEEEEVEERPSRFRRFFRFVKENMSDD
ncbi:hypothetical protein D0Z03_002306 [Geotrichum reessii]|nr:hypothetical protein D0Z03_002306 [Galactomyces reessii]